MSLRRRRAADPEIARVRAAFVALARRLDAAQRGLLIAIPTSWDPGIPLAQALAEFNLQLAECERLMPGWRAARLAQEWERCRAAIEEARAAAERLRLEPAELTFEQLGARVGEVLAPLEAFADAERSVRDLAGRRR